MKISVVKTPYGWELRTPLGGPVGPRLLKQDPVKGRDWPPVQATFATQDEAARAAFAWHVYFVTSQMKKARK